MQRIRIGLTGLAFVFVLVLLGAVVSRSSRDGSGLSNSAKVVQNSEPTDPLSDLGVAPGLPSESSNSSANSTKAK